MSTWNVDVQLLWKGEPWSNKAVKLYYKPGRLLDFGSCFSKVSYTDEDGHASFEIEDDDGDMRETTPIVITVSNHGNYDFGPYTLGGAAYTIDMDPDTPQETIPF